MKSEETKTQHKPLQFILQCEPWSSKEHQKSFSALSKNVARQNNKYGVSWLSHLVHWIEFFGDLWDLSDISPVNNMSWNFVASATHSTEGDVILKIISGKSNAIHEKQIIEYFASDSVVQIIDFYEKDECYAAILMKKINPGTSMRKKYKEKLDDAITPYAKIINEILRPYDKNKIQSLSGYDEVRRLFRKMDNIHKKIKNKDLIASCTKIKQELLNVLENSQTFVLHSDLHLENILQDEKSWVVIDPRGGIGTKETEISAFNIISSQESKKDIKEASAIIKKRAQHLAELTKCDSMQILKWRFLRCAWLYSSSGSSADKKHLEVLYYTIFGNQLTL